MPDRDGEERRKFLITFSTPRTEGLSSLFSNQMGEEPVGLPPRAFDLAEEYIESTDRFDRDACTAVRKHRGREVPVPANGDERVQIERHAREKMKDLLRQAEREGISAEEFKAALSQLQRRSNG